APVLGHGDVRVDQRAGKPAAIHPALSGDSRPGTELLGTELHRLPQCGSGRAPRPDRGRHRPGKTQRALAPNAGDLRRGAAGVAALLPRRFVLRAEMARRRRTDRPPGPDHDVDREVATAFAMKPFVRTAALLLATVISFAAPAAQAKNELVIGVTQF